MLSLAQGREICSRNHSLPFNQDASHVGKLKVFKNTVDRACDDNVPPGQR